MPQIEAKPTKNYREVIQVNVPTRFYWDDEGFDGIEFGPFEDKLMPWEEDMMMECLEALGGDRDECEEYEVE